MNQLGAKMCLSLRPMLMLIPTASVCFALISEAHAAPTDYDGTWLVSLECGASVYQAPGFRAHFGVAIAAGQLKTRNSEWKGRIQDQTVTVEAERYVHSEGRRERYSFSGKPTSSHRMELSGTYWSGIGGFTGGLQPTRTCTLILDLVKPAPLSLAAQEEQGSSGPNDLHSPKAISSAPPPPPRTSATQEDAAHHQFVASLHPNDVREIQAALKKRSLYSGQIDGIWGLGTDRAVRAWQAKNGLQTTGTLSTDQIGELTRVNEATKETSSPSPSPTHSVSDAQRSRPVAPSDADLVERETQLAKRERQLAEREEKIAKERAAQEQAARDKQLGEEKAAKERAAEAEQKRIAAEREQKERELDERERRLAEREKTISEQEKRLQSEQTNTSPPTTSSPVPFRWMSGFGQGTAVATIKNRRGSSLQFSCNSGGLPPIAPSLQVIFKNSPIPGEHIYQFVVDGKNYPISLKDGWSRSGMISQLNSLAATADALVESSKLKFRVEVPDAGIAEEFSLLNVKDALGKSGNTLANCSPRRAEYSIKAQGAASNPYTQVDVNALRLRYIADYGRSSHPRGNTGSIGDLAGLKAELLRQGWKQTKEFAPSPKAPSPQWCWGSFSRGAQMLTVGIFCAGENGHNSVYAIDLADNKIKSNANKISAVASTKSVEASSPSTPNMLQVEWNNLQGGWLGTLTKCDKKIIPGNFEGLVISSSSFRHLSPMGDDITCKISRVENVSNALQVSSSCPASDEAIANIPELTANPKKLYPRLENYSLNNDVLEVQFLDRTNGGQYQVEARTTYRRCRFVK